MKKIYLILFSIIVSIIVLAVFFQNEITKISLDMEKIKSDFTSFSSSTSSRMVHPSNKDFKCLIDIHDSQISAKDFNKYAANAVKTPMCIYDNVIY